MPAHPTRDPFYQMAIFKLIVHSCGPLVESGSILSTRNEDPCSDFTNNILSISLIHLVIRKRNGEPLRSMTCGSEYLHILQKVAPLSLSRLWSVSVDGPLRN